MDAALGIRSCSAGDRDDSAVIVARRPSERHVELCEVLAGKGASA
jgi:hypothetical protein